MKLKEILVGLDKIRAKGELDVEVSNISSNSKEVKKRDMFVVINGFESNGAEYIEEARHRQRCYFKNSRWNYNSFSRKCKACFGNICMQFL